MNKYKTVETNEHAAAVSLIVSSDPVYRPSQFEGQFNRLILFIVLLSLFILVFINFHRDEKQTPPLYCVNNTREIPPITSRNELGSLLQDEGMKDGAELGVQRGFYSAEILSRWKNMRSWHLIDIWKQQENYFDQANVNDAEQDKIYKEAFERLRAFTQGRLIFHRMYTSAAARLIVNNSLDFVYVDARHDYCGVVEDIALYWPKLRPNGILAGHDYMYGTPGQGWGVCRDGSHYNGAVKGAVDEFVAAKHLYLHVTNEAWPTWIVRKPDIKCF